MTRSIFSIRALLILLMLGLGISAHATEYRYSYGDLVYTPAIETNGIDGAGLAIEFSSQLHPNMRLLAELGGVEYEGTFRSQSYFAVGPGAVLRMSPSIDLLFNLQLLKLQSSGRSSGTRLLAGVRVQPSENLHATFAFVSERMQDNLSFGRVDALYEISSHFGLGARLQKGARTQSAGLMLRFRW